MLDQIIPFRYLSPSHRAALRADLREQTFEPGDVLIRQGDPDDKYVFLLETGTVEALDLARTPARHVRTISAGHYFGERAALFGEDRSLEVRAAERVRVMSMSGDRFLRLIRESTPFAQALGNILRDKQGIFTPFDRFSAELLRMIGLGRVDLKRLLPLYRDLDPALHPHASNPDIVDGGALEYAVRRLPDNLTRALAFYLTESLPRLYSDPDDRFTRVATAARRRAVYEMLPGKNMVLIRDGLSDIVDFITCLCLYAIEARKIRRRMRDRGGLDVDHGSDLETLRAVWPRDAEQRMTELALHHEDFRVEIHKSLNNYNSAHGETWSQQVAEATRELIGCDPSELPADFPVHVISSNTHSVTNCLSPWLANNAAAILAWAGDVAHPLVADEWINEYDLVCALARGYFDEHPKLLEQRAAADEESGILPLRWTAFTGIGVQLIDTARLSSDEIDPGLPAASAAGRSLIVNIDYAFGEQARHIIANLISLFGRNLSSVGVLGKAGGLQGDRGDVLVATGFVEQASDMFHPLPRGANIDIGWLESALPGRGIHQGNVLTVAGTLLQNRMMLHFNRHIWGCVGLEMEGSYYLRQVLESMNRGALSGDLAMRFLYYVSDLPLNNDSNLSAHMQAREGIPPLYAVTRHVLRGILEA